MDAMFGHVKVFGMKSIKRNINMTNLEKVEQKLTNKFRKEYLEKVLNGEDPEDTLFWLGVDYALIHIRCAIEEEKKLR